MSKAEKPAALSAEKRPYLVSGNGEERLINAQSQAQALRHAAKGVFEVKAANTAEVVRLMGSGVKVEEAGE